MKKQRNTQNKVNTSKSKDSGQSQQSPGREQRPTPDQNSELTQPKVIEITEEEFHANYPLLRNHWIARNAKRGALTDSHMNAMVRSEPAKLVSVQVARLKSQPDNSEPLQPHG